MTDQAPLLKVVGLKTFFHTPRGIVRAVDGVSFELAGDRTLAILGESGSGKTVLARSIMGLLPRSGVTRQGSVLYKGENLAEMGERELRRRRGADIAMVFQDPMTSLNPVHRIGRQVGETIRLHRRVSRGEARRRSVTLLRSVGIPDVERRARQYPHQLSGGMRQRVMIAMALACDPGLVLADEPTTALDVTAQDQILTLLAAQRARRSMGLLLVTHDLGVAAGRTDEIAVMYAGRIVEQAPTERLFAAAKMPYTEALMKSIPKLSDPPHTRLAAIPGRPPDLVDPGPGCAFAPRCRYSAARCAREAPPLRTIPGTRHRYACWHPVGGES
ncbi:dipeptide/oligopeptide/nickel ABC transporter ATP-binding protein [Spongiactinospora gelatinilytica]|uniref:Dipeptide/oligopeptide/nickel ABC transporter ATP-binding protein n=1 Tax=Spongiactinospora gelatinilytica TaxID=2666298 RepID=A0A2W2HAY7_9ACTN|nr:ABC transporter ATP-binding protein [Spongiactinospora gelatinilytica]PZG46678.1 dipeptide/oligopeptide/nickel ABC transporter ATP-binding protein [Spongiactinospora gelatinilytica]